MLKCRQALTCIVLLMAGCRTPPLPSIDQSVNYYASRPYDVAPAVAPKTATPAAKDAASDAATSTSGVPRQQARAGEIVPLPRVEGPSTGQAAIMRSPIVLVTALEQELRPNGPVAPVVPAGPGVASGPPRKFDLNIPGAIPGSETPHIKLPRDSAGRARAISRLYPQLPPLTEEPEPQLSPSGRPYTLDDLQRLAAANSPALRQAAADVENARGLMQQARTYQNPTTGTGVQPNANNTGSSTYGVFIDQVISTAGKMKLASAIAQVNLSNAELALRKARNDLATQVRTTYYGLVVARETVRINRVLARFTDEVYRLQTDLLAGGFAASHEPAALRSQVFVVRLAHQQAVNNYAYAWKQLVAAIGLPQMPLSAVEGQVDRFIPYYEYDDVLAYVLRNHTDVLTARNDLVSAGYQLKLAQVTPVPNLDVAGSVWQENQIQPRMEYHQMSVSVQLPIWDQNKGNIRAAAAARARASEEPHQAQLALTTGLAAAYGAYQDNLAAVEYYRMYILPDQVRYYRGVFERRQIDPTFAFNDLVTAQQNLVVDVTAYLAILGQLWTSVINVADYLQTDDFYQLARPLELPPLPEFDAPPCWPCPHPHPAGMACVDGHLVGVGAGGKAPATSTPATSTAAATPAALMPAPLAPAATALTPPTFAPAALIPTASAPAAIPTQLPGAAGRTAACGRAGRICGACRNGCARDASTREHAEAARSQSITSNAGRCPSDWTACSDTRGDCVTFVALVRQADHGSLEDDQPY